MLKLPLSCLSRAVCLLLDADDADRPGRFTKGCAIGCGLAGLIVVLAFGMDTALGRENRRRDRLYGPADEAAQVDVTDEGHGHGHFRYVR